MVNYSLVPMWTIYAEPIVFIFAKMYFSKQISNEQTRGNRGFFSDLWKTITGGRTEVEKVCGPPGHDMQACFNVIAKTLKSAQDMLELANETFAAKRGEKEEDKAKDGEMDEKKDENNEEKARKIRDNLSMLFGLLRGYF